MRPSVRIWAAMACCALVAACSGGDVLTGGASSSPTTRAASTTSAPAGADTTAPLTASTLAEGAEPAISWQIDETLDGGGAEVVASANGRTRFTNARVVVADDDGSDAADLVDRYGGRLVRRIATTDYGIPGPVMSVIDVDLTTADLDALAVSLTELGSSGSITFGSEDGARTAAIAAAARASGLRVGLDWVAEPTSIPFSTEEAPNAVGPTWMGWDTDAYLLDYYGLGTVQGIGVAEAWSLMYYAGALSNRVPLAVVDWGFAPDEDLPDAVAVSLDPSVPIGETIDGDLFHGHITATTAMAVPDNGFGVAGVAGVVAEPILVQPLGTEYAESMEAVLTAYDMGARIISMSFICPILPELGPIADTLDEVIAGLAESGVLLFASSGNGGGNVDEIVAELDYLLGTRPCQAPGVICVGGLAPGSVVRDEDSTYGDPGGSVDIYAPYCVATGVQPGGDRVRWDCGTSVSAPFAAGVAALVWASDPGLTARQVWTLMETNARGGRWPRVNAINAVSEALGPFVVVDFVEPSAGHASVELGRATTLAARAIIPADPGGGAGEVRVVFSSDLDGVLSDHNWSVPTSASSAVAYQRVSVSPVLSEGTHTITVEITYQGETASDTVVIDVGNSPPSDLRITRPADGEEFCEGATVQLRGDAFDINEQLGLPDSAFRWVSSIDGGLGHGRNRQAGDLSVGDHVITMRVTDAGGLRTTESVEITVLPASSPGCVDAPPDVRINRPTDGASFYVDDPDEETGVDDDGAYVVVRLHARVEDDRDDVDDMTIDFYVSPGEPDPWVGSGNDLEVRLHLADGDCSEAKTIRVVVFDSGHNRVEDEIEVFVNRFC